MNLESDVKKAQRGDREAFVRLMRELESDLYGMAFSILRKEEDCADVLQETVLKAYTSVGGLRKPAYFKTWIFRILINECNKVLHKRASIVPVAEFPNEASTSDGYEQIEMREAIDQLEDSMRIVVCLHYLRDMSIREISHILDLTESAVKTRLHRARKALLDILQQPDEQEMILHESL